MNRASAMILQIEDTKVTETCAIRTLEFTRTSDAHVPDAEAREKSSPRALTRPSSNPPQSFERRKRKQ
jgi:hypothetical protein